MKGQIAVLEAITMIVLLFVSFSIFFAPRSYQDNWRLANILVNARDTILTLDRTGLLYNYSVDPPLMNGFLSKVIAQRNMLYWYQTDSAIKSSVGIDCVCTANQISTLSSWAHNVQFNNRSVNVVVCQTGLSSINPCIGSQPDVLLIWGYQDLTQYYQVITQFLQTGGGIVEIMDVPTEDTVQKNIFGLDICSGCGWGSNSNDAFIQPAAANSSAYQAYKYFYHLPLNLPSTGFQTSMPTDGPICTTPNLPDGTFTLHSTAYQFWICNSTTVFFDTNNDGKADMPVTLSNPTFQIGGSTFVLRYVNTYNIGIAFSPNPSFNFVDFMKDGGDKIYQTENDSKKILLSLGTYNGVNPYTIPVVITNGTVGKTAWVSDFTRNTLNPGDEYRQLLISLLLSVSNKVTTSASSTQLSLGYVTSYVNTVDQDMYEVSDFSLALGFPK